MKKSGILLLLLALLLGPLPAEARELPLPENTPAGKDCAAVTYRVVEETVYASGTLYVRSGPGSRYEILGSLTRGQQVLRGAVGNNGWSQILWNGREAYVNSTYLSVTPVAPREEESSVSYTPVSDTMYARVMTKLRSGPGPDYPVVGHLALGNGARRTAQGDNGWSRIVFHDTEVYACTGDLSPVPPDSEKTVYPFYLPTAETLYVASGSTVRKSPSLEAEPVVELNRGDAVLLVARGDNGWSRIQWQNREGYIRTGYLTREAPGPAPAIVTSEPIRTTPNSPFLYQYMAPEGVMPHGVFTPVDADLSQPLPLILSLHGALEIGESPETIRSNFITKEFSNWEYTGLAGFDAYIVCPQLTGFGLSDTWSCQESADNLFALIDYLKAHYNIDETRISMEGHSLGGQGVLYMAADPRACFSAVVPVSGYDPRVDCSGITAAMRGFTGSPYLPTPREDWTSFEFMTSVFEEHFGSENLFMKNCSHYDIPMVALEEDADGDGRSDLIDWMLSQQRK